MKFTVKFKSSCRWAIETKPYIKGVALVDFARKITGVPNLSTERIDGTVPTLYENPEFEISEAEARKSGLFENNAHMEVSVPDGFLSQLTKYATNADQNDETGEVLNVSFHIKANAERIISLWAACGYPEEWNEETAKGLEIV